MKGPPLEFQPLVHMARRTFLREDDGRHGDPARSRQSGVERRIRHSARALSRWTTSGTRAAVVRSLAEPPNEVVSV